MSQDEEQFLKISLTDTFKKTPPKPSKEVDLLDHTEVNPHYIHLMKSTWLKYKDKATDQVFSGGVVIEDTKDTCTLRNIQQKITVLNKKETIFYCKSNNPLYLAVKDIIIERQKLHIERVRLYHEKQRLEALEKQLKSNFT